MKKEHLSPGERNPVEGKFGQAKTAYGLANIKARLKDTSESWIACIFLVLNLVKLAGAAPLCLLLKTITRGFSASDYKVPDWKLWLSELTWPSARGQNWIFWAF